ncbi:phosphotransferase system eiib component type 2/3 [Lucifera butyrica]|uniref:Phosphotransferase system eiib component type 2/3 n=1 Tax=Lucifera butyrica TaxID=1351585 RepID=A0A498REK8_9FIRM|nr:BglG family transcription antiterminator [Lucifera butyrica]VBB09192.1 phosphotransferase system eiib component type 2/3 [Lucifera butyrica]VBB09445.1 phosphotransferase system eiib component type 2/3 [Lucifera butyrica]
MQEKMNVRVKKILLAICRENDYVTLSTIAQELGVSARTILRELDEVESWLAARGCSLSKKTGAGIKVSANAVQREEMLALLREEQEEIIYSPQERQMFIISELLQNQEPVKLYNFAAILKVTEGTISNDLDKIEKWFAGHQITLVRKPGLGVYIEGRESNIRKAMIRFIYENMDEEQLLRMIRNYIKNSSSDPKDGIENRSRKRLLNLIDKEVIRRLETSIQAAEQKMGYKLTDNAYVGLIVHLALAIQRIKKNEEITIDKEFLNELKRLPEYTVAGDMAAVIATQFALPIPEDEIGYITMHLKGSRNRSDTFQSAGQPLGNFELVKLAREMIKVAEQTTGYSLAANENLLIGLVNHLGPSISRLKMNLDIRNPLLDKIKAFYPDLLEVSRTCAAVVEKQLGVTMPESEIAYIAMHLGAAIENCAKIAKRIYRCAIACATGIGTSRLLATRMEKEFDNIKIVDIISTIYIEEKWLGEQKVDFIVSTVGIENCSLPVVTVNPLLFEEDKIKIIQQMKMTKKQIPVSPVRKENPMALKDKLNALSSYSEAITRILDNFFLREDRDSRTMEEVIDKISRTLGEEANQARLAQAIMRREEKGGTFITGHGMVLLHCRSEAVKTIHFGAVKILNSIRVINGKGQPEDVKLAVIMLAPEHCGKIEMETLSHLSRMLIERPEFSGLLTTGNYEEDFREISHIMEELYKTKNRQLMGD